MQPGDHVTPQVVLERPLSAGGMGTVWLARHLALETDVAVKVLNAEFANHPEAIARFRREAATAAKVKSPHIVQQLDHGITSEGAPFIVMEYLHGSDLAQHLEASGRLHTEMVAQVIKQTSRALAVAHESGVVHRDIKPANLFLVDNDGELFVKVLDFGIAKTDGTNPSNGVSTSQPNIGLTQVGSVLGTPPYMSPEQLFADGVIDARADLWALAAVTYECLTGRVPFAGDSLAALGVSVTQRDYVRASDINGSVPTEVDEWFQKAFATKLEDRFQNARDLGDSLAAALQFPVTRSSISLVSPPPARSVPSGQSMSLAATLQASGGLGVVPQAVPSAAAVTRSKAPLAAIVAIALLLVAGSVAIGAFARNSASKPNIERPVFSRATGASRAGPEEQTPGSGAAAPTRREAPPLPPTPAPAIAEPHADAMPEAANTETAPEPQPTAAALAEAESARRERDRLRAEIDRLRYGQPHRPRREARQAPSRHTTPPVVQPRRPRPAQSQPTPAKRPPAKTPAPPRRAAQDLAF